MSGSGGMPTWSCAHVREQIGAYVIDGLERDERALVEAHLATCRDCAAEYQALAGLPRLLDHAAGLEIEPPRPVLEERVLDAVARERGRGRRPRRLRPRIPARARFAAAAALAGAALGAAATALALSAGDEESPAGGGRAAAPPPRHSIVLSGARGAKGRVSLESKAGGTVVHLAVKGLPGNRDAVYEVRCEARDWSASAGTFRTDGRGHAYAVFHTAARPGEYERIRIVRRTRGRTTPVMSGRIS